MVVSCPIAKLIEPNLRGHLDRVQFGRVKNHCRTCEACKLELSRQAWHVLLQGGKDELVWEPREGDCFSEETLLQCHAGHLQQQEEELVRPHLAACPTCQLNLAAGLCG